MNERSMRRAGDVAPGGEQPRHRTGSPHTIAPFIETAAARSSGTRLFEMLPVRSEAQDEDAGPPA